ncbi:hypothetical protein SLS62_009900 [Diatrype stigma]|uniref:Uncharacterized protein n=1 Tax=Diatrype stigma TaxID=117547 RepID=A0AAN9YJJ2_9PEZI
MGGKTWSVQEEEHFWRVAVSSSPKRIGKDLAKPEKSWDLLAREMQRAMGREARRKYTPTMLFEHFFQNVETGRKSPNSVVYVMEYLARRDYRLLVAVTFPIPATMGKAYTIRHLVDRQKDLPSLFYRPLCPFSQLTRQPTRQHTRQHTRWFTSQRVRHSISQSMAGVRQSGNPSGVRSRQPSRL